MTPRPHPLRRPQTGEATRVVVFGTQDEARRHGAKQRGGSLELDGQIVVTPRSLRPLQGIRVSAYTVVGSSASEHPNYWKLIATLDVCVRKTKEAGVGQ